jgi:serine protease Do
MNGRHLTIFVFVSFFTAVPVYVALRVDPSQPAQHDGVRDWTPEMENERVVPRVVTEERQPEVVPVVATSTPRPSPAPVVRPAASKPLTAEEIVSRCSPSVALIRGRLGHGTGFLVAPGILATNSHVIGMEFVDQVTVHFPSAPIGKRGPHRCRLLWQNGRRDLAFLEVKTDLPPLTLAEDYHFRSGQEVLVIGSPGIGNEQALENAVSRGLMSTSVNLDRQKYFQISIAVNPGNSGGPVLDTNGRVLAVVTAKMLNKEGIAFGIPLKDLFVGIAEAENTDSVELQMHAAAHRIWVVVNRMVELNRVHLNGMAQRATIMAEVATRSKDPRDAVREASKPQTDLLMVVARISHTLEPQVNQAINDPIVSRRDRDNIRLLWELTQHIKASYYKPTAPASSYDKQRKDLDARLKEVLKTLDRITICVEPDTKHGN